MVSNLNPYSQQFVYNLNRIADRMQTAQQQISTGVRVNQVSDAPDSISTLLAARASLSAAQQIQANLGRVKTEVDSGEQALQTAVQLFDQVQTLGAQGDDSMATADTRAQISQQLDGILQQLVGIASTRVEGRYIFSGDADQRPPYTLDLTQANPVSAYQGSAATRVAQNPHGGTFPISETAQTIFDSADPATNVFAAITALRTAINNNDDAGIQAAVSGLSKVGDYLNQQLAFYGTVQNNVAQATNDSQTMQTQLQAQISDLQDTDMTSAILELTQSQTAQQAALQSEALIPRTSLLNYIQS